MKVHIEKYILMYILMYILVYDSLALLQVKELGKVLIQMFA